MKSFKITVLTSTNKGARTGNIRVYRGHTLVFSKTWSSIEQMEAYKEAIKQIVDTPQSKLRLVA